MVLVVCVVMAMRVRMAGAVGMVVLVFVEDDLEPAAKAIRDPAERREAWHVIAALKAGNHGFCHAHALGELLLGFARVSAQFEQPSRALSRDRGAVVEPGLGFGGVGFTGHLRDLAKLLSSGNAYCVRVCVASNAGCL
nr:hypothetical protein [Mesorhizobium sp.]